MPTKLESKLLSGRLPLLGKLPSARQLQILTGALVFFLLVDAAVVWLDARQSTFGTVYIATVGKIRMLSQRLAKAAQQASQGNLEAFKQLRESRDEIRAALEAGVRALNVESLGELDAVAEEAVAAGAVAPVSVRLNPDVETDTHEYVATGSARSKFGLGLEQARRAYERSAADPALAPVGLSFHVGSQLVDPAPVLSAAEAAAGLWRELAAAGIELRDLDVGGGLGIAYDGGEDAEVEPYAAALAGVARELGAELLLEPGRWLVGPVGTFVTRVLYVKDAPGRRIAVCDGGMNDLIRPALYGARHPTSFVGVNGRPEGTVDVVGPVCETGDFFALGAELPLPEPGDLLALGQAGAYCRVMASAYNARPLVPGFNDRGRL
jgi:diaminopimelate decarboxylase